MALQTMTRAEIHAALNPPQPGLTPQQIAVLSAFANGYSRAGTAKHLHLSESTVASHLRAIRQRLQARTTTQAVAIAVAAGVVEVGGGS